jgi:hypothetical protein
LSSHSSAHDLHTNTNLISFLFSVSKPSSTAATIIAAISRNSYHLFGSLGCFSWLGSFGWWFWWIFERNVGGFDGFGCPTPPSLSGFDGICNDVLRLVSTVYVFVCDWSTISFGFVYVDTDILFVTCLY